LDVAEFNPGCRPLITAVLILEDRQRAKFLGFASKKWKGEVTMDGETQLKKNPGFAGSDRFHATKQEVVAAAIVS